MRRYIDADILKDKTTRVNNIWNGTTNAEGKGLDEIIDDIPTADVRENVRANLVIAGYKINGSTQWFECSVCGGSVDFTDNFCKHCGAYFKGGYNMICDKWLHVYGNKLGTGVNCEWVDDVRENVRGVWIPVTNGRGGFECSKCHDYAPSYQNGDDYLSHYCPNCGADMRGGKSE